MKKKVLCLFMASAIAIGSFAASTTVGNTNIIQVQASQYSNMQSVLDLYKKGDYKKAVSKASQYPANAKEKCVSKMSNKMKQAYLKKVKKYKNFSQHLDDFDKGLNDEYIWGYYLTDFKGNGKAELLIQHGTCEADVSMTVYKYSNGKAKKIGSFYCGHSTFSAYPNRAGIIVTEQHMGAEAVSKAFLSKGKIKFTTYGSREVSNVEDYITLPYKLNGHLKKNGVDVSYEALKND